MKGKEKYRNEELYHIQDLCKKFKVSIRTIKRWVATGRIPKPIRITRTCVRWRKSEIEDYLENLQNNE